MRVKVSRPIKVLFKLSCVIPWNSCLWSNIANCKEFKKLVEFDKKVHLHECNVHTNFLSFRATETKSSLLTTLNNFVSSVSIPEDSQVVNVKTAEINIQVEPTEVMMKLI